ncbi:MULTISPECIES: right-handed parallel beta-helix repeat-containing protein [unclassified Actinotalea]|uniref:right-handed parallel beta-helix repeat-containing protein n=1 Tax=unclassified Actinotalea TaxID=2638618 RepID=UPI0015F724CE|nr:MULTISPECIES: right-handed parallel beta-helix repeat-containing protein [unclassified Actinotalea]
MSRRRVPRPSSRPACRAATVVALAVALACTAAPASASESADPGGGGSPAAEESAREAATDRAAADDDAATVLGSAYPGNPVTEPSLVADEEDRLADVQTVGRMIQWGKLPVFGAYRLSTGSAYTLVLTRRSEPYTLSDLLELAPQTFVREPDGAYLLSENIVVQPGARLVMSNTGPLTIRMASDTDRFVSIVNMGGELEIVGTAASPVTLTSWNRDSGTEDETTQDGRAYVRSVGGKVTLEGTTFSHLGFWSGRTGGVALTGVDRPSEGALEEYGRDLGDAVASNNAASGLDVPFGTVPDANPTVVDPTVVDPAVVDPTVVDPAVPRGEVLQDATAGSPVEGLLPAGTLPVPYTDDEDPEYSYVSAKVEDVTFDGNAFGLFISSANGVDISGSTITGSLVDGLTMHRYVVNAAVTDTVSEDNAGHGFVLARATTGIVLSEVSARRNSGSGIVIRGSALANGPSATGMPVGDYGNNSVSNSSADENARYGIEIIGGRNISLNSNDVTANDMGIVVREGASDITLVGNHFEDNVRHAVALRDAATDVEITGNIISDSPTGVYVRDSSATVVRNTLDGLTNHAVTAIGLTPGTLVEANTVSGRGPSAVDVKRAEGATVGENDLSDWESTKPFWTAVRNTLQPLTLMWLALGLIVISTAVKGARQRRERRHPYQEQAKMADLVEAPVDLGRAEDPPGDGGKHARGGRELVDAERGGQ